MGRGVGIALAVVALCAVPALSAPAAAIPRDEFCVARELVHYGPPAGLPALRKAPASGKLAFGPGRLRLSTPRQFAMADRMALTTRGVLFELSAVGGSGALRLGWRVDSSLAAVKASGRAGKVVERRSQLLAAVGTRGKPVGIKPGSVGAGLYRLDLVFRDASGARLGSYSDYIEVVAPLSEFHLALNGTAFAPGEVVFGQLQNPGTDGLLYEDDYVLDRFVNGSWVRVAEHAPAAVGTTALAPGRSDSCEFAFAIPIDAPPGTYRLTKGVIVHRPARPASTSVEFAVEARG